ncbi:MAG: glycosyltransferase family 4 protein [Candidatus Krumholzibacteriota bacterium]|nr:glycosyltransferase family 4 protein [Candidatus Krumholzibacteriota bacterium]
MKVAIIGSKGLPALFGGIERHVEEIGRRLALKGHEITVFGRKPFCDRAEYLGMKIEVVPSIPTKNLDTATTSFLSSLIIAFRGYDIIHYHGVGPSIFSGLGRLSGKKTVSTVHALDYRQQKWGKVAKYMLKTGERCAVRNTDAVIAVSRLMKGQLSAEYGREVSYIPNGATICDTPEFSDSCGLGLKKERYILTVGRFIVERGFHTLIDAFSRIDTDMKLVIVGDERFESEYAGMLHEKADSRVIFPGYISGDRLSELYAHCAFYVLPSIVEGLPISLIEAMSFSRPVLISDIPENLEVAGELSLRFIHDDPGDLVRAMNEMIGLDDESRSRFGRMGKEKVLSEYNWDSIAESTERLYQDLISR